MQPNISCQLNKLYTYTCYSFFLLSVIHTTFDVVFLHIDIIPKYFLFVRYKEHGWLISAVNNNVQKYNCQHLILHNFVHMNISDMFLR